MRRKKVSSPSRRSRFALGGVVLALIVLIPVLFCCGVVFSADNGTRSVESQSLSPQEHSLPVGQVKSPKEIQSGYFLATSTPFGEKDLAFRILTPRGWKGLDLRAPAKESSDMLVPLGMFVPSADPASGQLIEVSYLLLRNEVNPNDWLSAYIEGARMSFVKGRSVKYGSREATDVLVERRIDATSAALTRLSVSKMGNWIVLVSCTAPKRDYEKLADTFSLACATFEFSKPHKGTFAERLSQKKVSVCGKASMVMKYPGSWRSVLIRSPEGTACCDVRFEADKQLISFMRIKMYDPSRFRRLSQEKSMQLAMDEMTSSGFKILGTVRKTTARLRGLSGTAKLVTFGAQSPKGLKNELVLAYVRTPDFIIQVTSLRPVSTRDARGWMIGKRALEILLEQSRIK